jgi:phosphoribosylformylglycinamidine synthase
VEGGKQAVAEAYRNLCAVGAKPLAITNCLNFGNPQRPEIMGQFVGCVEGMAEACRVLNFPVVSGNVSLYNETKNEDGSSLAILPTPAIGGVGLLDDWEISATIGFKAEGDRIYHLGKRQDQERLGCSLYLEVCHGRRDGSPPEVDLQQERRYGELVRRLIDSQLVTAVHDASDGGALVAIAEMALAGDFGAELSTHCSGGVSDWFGEGQGRYIVTTREPNRLEKLLSEEGFVFEPWGQVTSDKRLRLDGGDRASANRMSVPLADLRAACEGFFPKLMGSELTPEF